jgi:glutaredoxin
VTSKIRLQLITRQGCHLCDEAQDVLAGVIARFSNEHPSVSYTVETIDIDRSPELLAQYSDEVPVLLLNEDQISFFRIDADRVLMKLKTLV